MMSSVKPIPDGYHTVTPHVFLKDIAKAIDFYKQAFGAEEIYRMPGPGGQGVMHAEIRIGDSNIMLAGEWPQPDSPTASAETLGKTTVSIMLYVTDADAAFKQAVAAGATAIMEPNDAFWGDRYAMVKDPFGHGWEIATHKEDLTPEQIGERAAKWMAEKCS
jgi:PhnB protein